jgi:hypothetical protein
MKFSIAYLTKEEGKKKNSWVYGCLQKQLEATKEGNKDITGGAHKQEMPVTLGVIWMKGQPPF